jgi:hypothetical protein
VEEEPAAGAPADVDAIVERRAATRRSENRKLIELLRKADASRRAARDAVAPGNVVGLREWVAVDAHGDGRVAPRHCRALKTPQRGARQQQVQDTCSGHGRAAEHSVWLSKPQDEIPQR